MAYVMAYVIAARDISQPAHATEGRSLLRCQCPQVRQERKTDMSESANTPTVVLVHGREIGGPRVGPDRQTGASSAADGSAMGAVFGTRRPASSATAKMASALRPCSAPTMAAE